MSPDTSNPTHVLIISDDPEVTRGIVDLFAGTGFVVHTTSNGRSGVNMAGQFPVSLLITGMVMRGMQGNEIIREIKGIHEKATVWVITEARNFNLDFAVEAIKLGADDYFVIFEDLPSEKMRKALAAFQEKIHLIAENRRLQERVRSGEARDSFMGNCETIRNLNHLIKKVAPTDAPVLITGESGTGKELVARTLWELSDRANRPYIPINCGAIPENLLESELFGHEKGAFTGAHALKIGKFENGDKGTVFLDEIGEMSANLQVKLLRFLQEGEIQRVGSARTIRLDVRIISATNKDLEEEIARNNFREDLYYRLNVINLHLPPLRERGNDVLDLAHFFVRALAVKERREVFSFSPLAMSRIREYNWPGNIRELKHRIHRAVILAAGREITAEDLGFLEKQERLTLNEAMEQFEFRFVTEALIAASGNISRAARSLGTARQQLQRIIRKYGIRPESYRRQPSVKNLE